MLNIGNKKYRNLQEQVAYNTECIQELAEAIDGITLEDKLVIIANDSGTFTDEEMTVLNGPLAFISDGSKVWLKQSETASEFVFKAIDIVATEQGGTHFSVGGSKIVVTRATRAYVTSDDVIITTYNKTQIDSLLALKADLSGANFTGAVTAPTFKQSQYNYTKSFNLVSTASITVNNIYNRFVEINNVLHIIVNITLTNNSGSPVTIGSGYAYCGFTSLTLDASIASKIVDIEGKTVADPTATLDVLIASEPAQILLSKILDSNTKFRSARMSLVNRSAENTCAVYIALNGDAGDRLTMADGDTIYVTARMALTLI